MKRIAAAMAVFSVAAISSCNLLNKKSDDNTGTLAMAALALNQSNTITGAVSFEALASGNAVSCSTPPGTGVTIANALNNGTGGAYNIVVQDLRFYISNIKLIDASDNLVDVSLAANNFQDPATGVVLLDFEDKTGACTNGTTETHTSIQMNYPAGNYKGIQFDIGIPDASNRLYYAGSPAAGTPGVYSYSGMYWTWAGAYKFTKLEFKNTGSTNNGYVSVLHLGSSGNAVTNMSCDDVTLTATATTAVADNVHPAVPNSCIYMNRSTIRLTGTSFDPVTNKVALDLASLFSGTNTVFASSAMMSCMSGRTNVSSTSSNLKTPCTDLFANLGVSSTTGGSTGSQIAFSLK